MGDSGNDADHGTHYTHAAMEEDDFISKTRRKRHMTDLQVAGAALVKLSPEQLARMQLPEELREAVLECKRYTKHEAIRRQMQYIGRIMRNIDAGPILAQLAALEAPSKRQTALFHVAERWRQDLLADPASIALFVKEFPSADPDRLRELVTAAQEEKRGAKPPKNFRELFHVLNALVQDHSGKRP
jgi:ribosome-associated protein